MALVWGLGLGLLDATFFGLARESYKSWSRLASPNATDADMTRVWTVLGGAGAVGGILAPLMYLWAAYSVGSLVEIHIYRCVVSVLVSLLLGAFVFQDTINGFRALGVLFSMLGLVLVLSSSAFAVKDKSI
uniref:EamA domain-containing protein n=1 Tax=viral metagenome TaxID=1070528 RepID=A0A6C0KY09_9ZZZZ